MTWVAAAIGGSAILGYMGATSAADAQANAAANALGLTREQFNTLQQQNAPQRAAGYGALNTLGSMLPGQQQVYDAQGNPVGTQQGTGALTQMFGPEQLASNLAPNYAFMKNQGLGATAQTANVAGGGSNMDMARSKFAEDYASNAYQNALANYTGQQTNIYNRLSNLAGLGQTANQISGQGLTNMAQLGGGLMTDIGQARAGGMMGGANALAGGLNQYGGMNYLSSLNKPQTSVGGLDTLGASFGTGISYGSQDYGQYL
jgi:hypothetical protein